MPENQKLEIVIIDDDPIMCTMVQDTLQAKFPGSIFSVFHTGEQAVAEMAVAPQIIILDYQLDSETPGAMNGIQVMTKLKKKFQHAPVIFLSSDDHAEIAANTIMYGAHDYVVKNEMAFKKLEMIIHKLVDVVKIHKEAGKHKIFHTVIIAAIFTLIILILMFSLR